VTTADSARPAVRMHGITKRFGDLTANDRVDLSIDRGEIHALLGENGAGKTTLVRILYGLSRPDEGTIAIDGKPTAIRSPKDAIAAGLGMVTQHFSLVGPMTVAENLVLGATPGFRIHPDAARRRVSEASERFDISVDPDAIVDRLSVGGRQRVEILKALMRECRVLILDEPTAVLVPQEVDGLFTSIRRLCAEGLSVVFISHKLNEVMAICDNITVLSHGRVAGTVARGQTDERELARMMIGDITFGVRAERAREPGPVLLDVSALRVGSPDGIRGLEDVSLSVRGGEILGIAGVSGNGQSELAAALSGMAIPDSGSITVDGVHLAGAPPARFIAAGVGRIAEDRHAGIVGDFSVAYNMALEHLGSFRKRAVLDERRMRAHAADLIDRFGIKASPDDRIRTLSGGNIQKALLARVLAREPKVIVAAQPTRGLDVGATDFVRRQLIAQRDRGAAVVLVSEDLDEILALSDRVAVMYEGRIVGAMDRRDADPDRLGLLMAGLRESA
jgi:general nucleoside transport system ATP-binding protein